MPAITQTTVREFIENAGMTGVTSNDIAKHFNTKSKFINRSYTAEHGDAFDSMWCGVYKLDGVENREHRHYPILPVAKPVVAPAPVVAPEPVVAMPVITKPKITLKPKAPVAMPAPAPEEGKYSKPEPRDDMPIRRMVASAMLDLEFTGADIIYFCCPETLLKVHDFRGDKNIAEAVRNNPIDIGATRRRMVEYGLARENCFQETVVEGGKNVYLDHGLNVRGGLKDDRHYQWSFRGYPWKPTTYNFDGDYDASAWDAHVDYALEAVGNAIVFKNSKPNSLTLTHPGGVEALVNGHYRTLRNGKKVYVRDYVRNKSYATSA